MREKPLPKCVKVGNRDKRSQQALLDEGWRLIGELMTWRGFVERVLDSHIKEVSGEAAVPLAKQIKWSGRLWSDPQITEKRAWAETERFLTETEDAVHMIGEVGFIVSSETEVKLIGVHPMVRGTGLAAILVRATRPLSGSHLSAGTYLHNRPAQKLYSDLGMKWDRRWAVFHKG